MKISEEDLKHLEQQYDNWEGVVEYTYDRDTAMSSIFLCTIKLNNGKYYQAEVNDCGDNDIDVFEDLEWKEVKPVEVITIHYIEVE